MKRVIGPLLLCAVLLPPRADAQLVRSFGLKLGAALTTQDWEYAHGASSLPTESRWGLDCGAFVEWFTMPLFSVSSEIHYVQKGFEYKILVTTEQNPDGTGTYKTYSPRLDYLSIPLLAKCRLDWESSSLYVFAGPRMDILLRTDAAGFGIVLDHLRSTEFGLTLGIGYVISEIAPFGIGAEFRYSPTLQDSYATDLLTVRNSSLEMMLVFTY